MTSTACSDFIGELNNAVKQNKLKKHSFATVFSSSFVTKELRDIRA
jgi:hypothetical protein